MKFLKNLFSGGAKVLKDETSEAIFMYSQCEKCGEKFRNRIDKQFDLMMNYEESGPAYRAHKELVGARCRNTIILDLEFDQQKRLTGKSIQRGQFITREEYEQAQEEER